MKKLMMVLVVVTAAAAVFGATTTRNKRGVKAMAGNEDGPVTQGRESKVLVDQMPKTGQSGCLAAPSVPGATMIGQCYQKPRRWIVLETKYTTMAKWQDELTFTWHVLLDSTKAKEKDPKNLPAQYSYYNAQVRYVDIKKGSHMASVCLPPSVLERFGEPVTVTLVITNKEGDELAFHTENADGNVAQAGEKWWENDKFMNWQKRGKKGESVTMVERRQGLLDRAKTPFYLVNNADYELAQ